MNKAAWIWAAAGCVAGTILIMGAAGNSTADQMACMRTTFHTQELLDACTGANGSQEAAKDEMKAFERDHQIASCNACHTKLWPNYELKDDGLSQFQRAGGHVLSLPVTITAASASSSSAFVPKAAPNQPTTPPGAGKVIGAPVGGALGH